MGDTQCAAQARSLAERISKLESFAYLTPEGTEKGLGVRIKARDLGELLARPDLLLREREKARDIREKLSCTSVGSGSTDLCTGFM